MPKIITKGELAHKALKRGVDAVGDAVRVTLGPKGKNVLLHRGYGAPTITNDGVSIAREIVLEDPTENQGAEVIKEVGQKQDDTSGDGTTTAIVLTQALVEGGMRSTAMGGDVIAVRNEMNDALAHALNILDAMKIEITTHDDIKHVASISAESEEIGAKIADLVTEVGKDGVVSVEESHGMGISYEHVEGMEFDKGYISPYAITNPERMEAEHKDVFVLITDRKISMQLDLVPIFQEVAKSGANELVLIAEDIDSEALTFMVVNHMRGFKTLAIKAPGFGNEKLEFLKDLAVLTGATVISDEAAIKWDQVNISMLGRATCVTSTKDSTTIVGTATKESVEERIAQIKVSLEAAEGKIDKGRYESRIAKLTGGVAVIKVGAATETEMRYMKDKITDAVKATKAAIAEGIVPGGGAALLHASHKMNEFYSATRTRGADILMEAMFRPILQIIENIGRKDGMVIASKVLDGGSTYGYNAKSEELITDMFLAGIVDPVKVVKGALERAVSAAGVLLTTEIVIVEKLKKESDF